MENTVTVTRAVEVPRQFLLDMLCTAAEGGANYWAAFSVPKGEDPGNYSKVHITETEPSEQPLLVPDGIVDEAAMLEGVRRLLQRDFTNPADWAAPHQSYTENLWRALCADDGADAGMLDADDADILMQVAAFGCLVYG